MEKPNPPSPIREPAPKKHKMSTDDEEFDPAVPAGADGGAPPEKKCKYKRRKVAIFFAYCGVGYQGMQKNPGAKTIEGDLEEALFHAGAVPEQDRSQPRRYDWARSARTDKGVSAVGQVVSGRFYVDPPGFVDRLNSNLSPQIRIFGYKRATASFNAKKFCDRRRYVYLIPVFALDPSAHRDRESVLASLGSGNELVKCLECSERGRKVMGLMGKRSFNSNNVVSSDSKDPPTHSETEEKMENGNSLGEKDKSTAMEVERESLLVTQKVDFCYGEQEKDKFNRILKYYEGTHNFHNFTTRTKAEDPSAKRYIITFAANDVVNVEGIDFVKCEVVGQSFMLHQIRKMVGLAVAIMRNCSPESLIQTAFRKDVNINVPMAPEVGLYLDECFFTSYNQKWNDHEELSMEDYADEAEDFKMKYIYTHIASAEHKEGVMALWLHSLNYRNYPDLALSNHDEKTADVKSDVTTNIHTNSVAAVDLCDLENEESVNGNTIECDDMALLCNMNKTGDLGTNTIETAAVANLHDGTNYSSANAEKA
ncbi:unnamed protein product [Cuscuta epithymum]|uniref:Pseudouridine synthase I TruA alpha/beta domain-containing protein n=2 Tax=Cuscuta epithymum TaxID=186058 RepID=A0AAV0F007_9ASTE|nr:unnamed protein product [Cuscuta epithymum]